MKDAATMNGLICNKEKVRWMNDVTNTVFLKCRSGSDGKAGNI
jgi:hypothetical protein